MTPGTAAVTGRTQTGAMGSAKCFVVPPGCQWCRNWIKAGTVKALRALALGNPASLLSSVSHFNLWGREEWRNGPLGNVGGSGVGLGSLLELQLWQSPALLLSSWNTAGKPLSFRHLGIISRGYSGKYKLWNIQEEARAIISLWLFVFQRWGWFPRKKPSQGLGWAGRSLEKALGRSAGDRLGTETLPEGHWSSSRLYSNPPTKGMAQPAWTVIPALNCAEYWELVPWNLTFSTYTAKLSTLRQARLSL